MNRFTVYESSHRSRDPGIKGKRIPDFSVYEEDGTEDGRLVALFYQDRDAAELYARWRNFPPETCPVAIAKGIEKCRDPACLICYTAFDDPWNEE